MDIDNELLNKFNAMFSFLKAKRGETIPVLIDYVANNNFDPKMLNWFKDNPSIMYFLHNLALKREDFKVVRYLIDNDYVMANKYIVQLFPYTNMKSMYEQYMGDGRIYEGDLSTGMAAYVDVCMTRLEGEYGDNALDHISFSNFKFLVEELLGEITNSLKFLKEYFDRFVRILELYSGSKYYETTKKMFDIYIEVWGWEEVDSVMHTFLNKWNRGLDILDFLIKEYDYKITTKILEGWILDKKWHFITEYKENIRELSGGQILILLRKYNESGIFDIEDSSVRIKKIREIINHL